VFVIFLYLLYVARASFGAAKLTLDIDEVRELTNDSPSKLFKQTSVKYFRYNNRVQVILNGYYDYENTTVRRRIDQMLSLAENGDKFVSGIYYTNSWLRQFDFWGNSMKQYFSTDDEEEGSDVSFNISQVLLFFFGK
jgi:hypothetical protein